MLLYPLKTAPCYKEMPWGGSGLNEKFNKKSPYEMTGESWEASDHPNGRTFIENGIYAGASLNELAEKFSNEFLGFESNQFPLLFKLIDAKERLSVQVHPNNRFAKEFGDNGKTEMWIVLDAKPGAGVFLGFNEPLTTTEYKNLIIEEKLEDVLNFVPAEPGDVFFLPAGLVHAIGKGLMIAEIQQSSDATFRVYDWGRSGIDGKLRKLHIEEALKSSDTTMRGEKSIKVCVKNEGNPDSYTEYLPACPYFAAVRFLTRGKIVENTNKTSFHIVFIEDGTAEITTSEGSCTAEKGETVLLPAAINTYQMAGKFSAIRFWRPASEKDYKDEIQRMGIAPEAADKLYINITE